MSVCTCHTTGCVNDGIGVDMELDVEIDGTPTHVEAVFCGGCSTQITDISGSDSTSDNGSDSASASMSDSTSDSGSDSTSDAGSESTS